MLNVANLHSEHFRRILAGEKATEWRRRKRPDGRLEAVTPGEPIVLLELGSSRAIRATVRACVRFDYEDGSCLYGIRITKPAILRAPGIRKVQGWHRRQSL